MATSPIELRIGPDVDPDRYSLGPAVGSGAEGILYRGWITTSSGLQLDVAIKMLQPGLLPFVHQWHARWSEQVELLRSLQIPGVVTVRDGFLGPLPHVGGHPGEGQTLYLIMNWVEGESLDEWMRRRPGYDPLDALKRLLPVAAALDLMHSGSATRGVPIVHRDIKPSNIVVVEDGAVLVDFGLTRGVPEGQRTSQVAGTAGYLAPEVVADGVYTSATDRYALGAVAYFVFTGTEPPTSHEPELMSVALASVEALSGKPEIVCHLMDMLATDPDVRPSPLTNWLGLLRGSSLTEVPGALAPIAPRRNPGAASVGVRVAPPAPTRPDETASRRRAAGRRVTLACVTAFCIAAVLIGTQLVARQPPRDLPLLYQDNFDGGQSWYEHDDESSSLAYHDGGYRMVLKRPNVTLLSDTNFRGGTYGEPLRLLTDASVRVTVAAASPGAVFGVFCRHNEGGYYAGLVRTDGQALIVKATVNGMQRLGSAAQVTLAPDGPTLLRLDCSGGTKPKLSLSVEGTETIDVIDRAGFSRGGVGLVVGSEAVAGQVLFDDFTLFGRRA